MAGIKGKSGGARANSGGARANSGGARPGAGRKKNEPQLLTLPATQKPLDFLINVMNSDADLKIRLAAATAAMPYTHAKMADSGVKDLAQAAAKKASTGRFAAAPAPLRAVK